MSAKLGLAVVAAAVLFSIVADFSGRLISGEGHCVAWAMDSDGNVYASGEGTTAAGALEGMQMPVNVRDLRIECEGK